MSCPPPSSSSSWGSSSAYSPGSSSGYSAGSSSGCPSASYGPYAAIAAAAKTQTEQLRDASIALLALSVFVNLLRFGTRMFLLKDRFTRLNGDDWLMLLAQIAFMVSTIVTIVYGTTTSLASGSAPSGSEVSSGIKITTSSYILAVTFVRLSLGWNFHALSRHSARWVANTILVIAVVSGLFGFGFFFFTIFTCGASTSVSRTVCRFENSYSITSIVWSFSAAVAEVLLAFLIFYFIIRYTHLPRNLKILVLALFAIGVLGFVSSFVRAAYVYKARGSTGLGYGLRVALWSVLEAGTCVIAASLATLKPLVVKIWRVGHPSALRSWNTKKSTKGQNTTVDKKGPEA